MRIIRRKSGDPLKGMMAGAAGGLVASWVMNQFQALLSRMTHGVERPHGAQSLQHGSPRHGVARELQERGRDREADNAAVWLIADEIIVPALGLSKPPTKYPLSTHASSIASHLVYGMTTEIVRREIRRALD